MINKIFWLTFLFSFICSYAVVSSLADGQQAEDFVVHEQALAEPTPNQASDASFDKRLPPVFPGEIINDSGKKIKLWSTSGPVPVQAAPAAPAAGISDKSDSILGKVDVIVDQRQSEANKDSRR